MICWKWLVGEKNSTKSSLAINEEMDVEKAEPGSKVLQGKKFAQFA